MFSRNLGSAGKETSWLKWKVKPEIHCTIEDLSGCHNSVFRALMAKAILELK